MKRYKYSDDREVLIGAAIAFALALLIALIK